MNREKLMLRKLNYEKYVLKAIEECETKELSFYRWLRNYGLYCSGKDLIREVEDIIRDLHDNNPYEYQRINNYINDILKDMQVDITILGEALHKAKMRERITKCEQELIEINRESIGADLVLANLGPKLGLTPRK